VLYGGYWCGAGRATLTLDEIQYAQVWCLDARHQKTMSVNMLRWYHAEQTGVLQRFPNARKYAAVVFRKPIVSVVIECFFSGMKYNQSTKRPNLSNETTACIVKTGVMTNPVVDPMAPTVAEVDWERARLHELPAGWGL